MTTLFSNDLLNPMLVRDLRQTLRSSRFTVIFLALHTGMACFVGIGLLSNVDSDIPSMIVGTLYVGLFLFYIVAMPMSSATALSSEFLENRMDLLKLTQMSARSLVWGKWLSLVTQGLLVIASLLPYLLLTYFFGDVNLAGMLGGVVGLLALNALLVALGVSLSCLNSPAFRILMVLGVVGFLFMMLTGSGMFFRYGPGPAFFMMGTGATTATAISIVTALYGLIGLPFIFLAMEFGAYCLAPAAENHDTPQRLVLLGLLVVAALALGLDAWHPTPALLAFLSVYFILAGLLAIWVMMFAAATDPSPYPHTYRPFVRFGYFGKLVGRVFLYPGWPSSTPFILLASAIFSTLARIWVSRRGLMGPDFLRMAMMFMLLPPALLFPQAVGWPLAGRLRLGPVARYFVIMIVLLVVFLFSIGLYSATDEPKILLAAGLFPPDAWLLFTFHWMDDFDLETASIIIALVTSALTIIVVCFRAFKTKEAVLRLEARAEAGLQPPKAPAAEPPRSEPTFSTQNPPGN
jgi:hypothetical protein